MARARSFADLVDDEGTGWSNDEDLARLRELAADDRPTLGSRFQTDFPVDPKSKSGRLHHFFTNWSDQRRMTKQFANHRMVVAYGMFQAAAARALDRHLAEKALANLRRLNGAMPGSVEGLTGWLSADSDITRYLMVVPKIQDYEDATEARGFPQMGASEDENGTFRIHVPLHWLGIPLENVVRRVSVKRNPFPRLEAVLREFQDLWSRWENRAESMSGVTKPDWVTRALDRPYGANREAWHVALAMGLAGGFEMRSRDLVRLGGPELGKRPSDLDDVMAFYSLNHAKRGKDGHVPKHITKGFFNKPQQKALIKEAWDAFDSVELLLTIVPKGLAERLGDPASMPADWAVSAKASSCIKLPRQLAANVSQSSEPSIRSISMWARDSFEFAFGGGPHPMPHPNTVDQVRKMRDVVRPVKITDDDDLAVDASGWVRYLPEMTLEEFESVDRQMAERGEVVLGGAKMHYPSMVDELSLVMPARARTANNKPATDEYSAWRRVKELNEARGDQGDEQLTDDALTAATNRLNEGLGVEDFDPVPAKAERNSVLYTNWHLGIVTFSDANGSIRLSSVVNWGKYKASRLMGLLRKASPMQMGVGGRSWPHSLSLMCREAGLSVRVADYVRPEDLSVFAPADKRGQQAPPDGEGLRIVPVGGPGSGEGAMDLDSVYGLDIDAIGPVINKVASMMTQLRTQLDSSREIRSRWEDGDDPRYDGASIVAVLDRAVKPESVWEMMHGLPAADGSQLPSPYAFLKRIIHAIHAAYGGDYRRLMGGDFAFHNGALSAHIGLTAALAKYGSHKELVDADSAERMPYLTQHDLDPDAGIEPIHNIGANAMAMPHQAHNDQRMAKDPDKQVMAVDPGGGKTIMLSVQRGVRTLAKGGKVLIICPNNLISNYIEDVAMMTDGQVNVITIDREVYQRYAEEGRVKDLLKTMQDSPPNTLFALGMNSLSSGEMSSFYYSGYLIKRSDVVELVRQVEWQLIMVDESHKMRNPGKVGTNNLASLFRGTPQLVQATGTYITDTVMDVWKQGSLLETGVFGSEDAFRKHFSQNTQGGKSTIIRADAETEAFEMLEQVADVMQVRRTEWAAWLPERVDEFEPCDDLNEKQQAAYDALFHLVINKSQLASGQPDPKPDDDDEDMSPEDEDDEDAAGWPLYNLEQFLSTMDLKESLPAEYNGRLPDDMKDLVLKGRDLISPKHRKIEEICKRHFDDPKAGKVLIFTQWKNAAEGIAEYLAPKFTNDNGGSRVLHYVAEKQRSMMTTIKSPTSGKDIIVGVQGSLQEGHNLQIASRVIMVESPYLPGAVNQVEARIYRPDLKEGSKDHRDKAYFTYLLIDGTVDMIKAARLVAKRLAAARGNNRDNPEYRSLDKNFGIIKLSRKNINAIRSWDDVPPTASLSRNEEGGLEEREEYFSLAQYLAYVGIDAPGNAPIPNSLVAIERREMEAVRKRGAGGFVPIRSAGTIPGSKVSADVPYIQNMRLPFQSDMGLINIATWASRELNKSEKDLSLDELEATGWRVHTQFGDGVITRYMKGGDRASAMIRVMVNDPDGRGGYRTVKVPLSSAFFITDPSLLDGKSVKVKLAEKVGFELESGGDPALRRSAFDIEDGEFEDVDDDPEWEDIDDEEDDLEDDEDEDEDGVDGEGPDGEPGDGDDPDLAPDEDAPHGYVRDEDGNLAPKFKLKAEVVSINGLFAIITHAQPDGSPQFDELTDTTAVIESYVFADISSRTRYEQAYDALGEAEHKGRLELTDKSWERMDGLNDAFRYGNRDKLVWNFRKAEMLDERNFFLEVSRRQRGKGINLYPVVWRDAESDGRGGFSARVRVYLMAHVSNQPQARDLVKVSGPVKWRRDATGFHVSFFKSKDEAMDDILDLDAQDNIEIVNVGEVRDSLLHIGIKTRGRRRARRS